MISNSCLSHSSRLRTAFSISRGPIVCSCPTAHAQFHASPHAFTVNVSRASPIACPCICGRQPYTVVCVCCDAFRRIAICATYNRPRTLGHCSTNVSACRHPYRHRYFYQSQEQSSIWTNCNGYFILHFKVLFSSNSLNWGLRQCGHFTSVTTSVSCFVNSCLIGWIISTIAFRNSYV
jgi:hypothetical protein